jgi:hypothetical protein
MLKIIRISTVQTIYSSQTCTWKDKVSCPSVHRLAKDLSGSARARSPTRRGVSRRAHMQRPPELPWKAKKRPQRDTDGHHNSRLRAHDSWTGSADQQRPDGARGRASEPNKSLPPTNRSGRSRGRSHHRPRRR